MAADKDTSAIDRELDWVKKTAGAPRKTRLGCSIISHDRLGFCDGCHRDRIEILGWRLLALREAKLNG